MIITNQLDADAHLRISGRHHLLLADEALPHTTLRGGVDGTGLDAAPKHPLVLPVLPHAPHPRPDRNHALPLQLAHNILRLTDEEPVLDPSLPTEVKDVVVVLGETGTEDHLLTRVEHMLMRTRPDVREAVRTVAVGAAVVRLVGHDAVAGAETEAGHAITASEVRKENTRTETGRRNPVVEIGTGTGTGTGTIRIRTAM